MVIAIAAPECAARPVSPRTRLVRALRVVVLRVKKPALVAMTTVLVVVDPVTVVLQAPHRIAVGVARALAVQLEAELQS